MNSHHRYVALLFSYLLFMLPAEQVLASTTWHMLKPGLEFASFQTEPAKHINILRIDPKYWKFNILSTTSNHTKALTARDWALQYQMTATINAGMFHVDHQTHVGYLKQKKHINSKQVNHYKSITAFSPYNDQAPFIEIIDAQQPKKDILSFINNYRYVVQNLRLIEYPAVNRWKPQKKKWREAALGIDRQKRILFIYSSTPYSMYDFNRYLLSFDLGLIRAQHLEGGLQAQLFINTQKLNTQHISSSTQQKLNQQNQTLAWEIPFVIGIQER